MKFNSLKTCGQGSLETLLLVAGGVLVATTILLIGIQSTDAGKIVLEQNLDTYDTELGLDFSGGGPVVTLPAVSIEATDPDAAEEGKDPGTFRISRTGDTSGELEVAYTVAGSASAADYDEDISPPITIPAGASFVDIVITPVDDDFVEGAETVAVEIEDTMDYDVGSLDSDTITIADNDTTALPVLSLSVEDATASEAGLDPGLFRITRDNVSGSLGVFINVSGSAENGTDYDMITVPVTILDGDAFVDIPVTPIDDTIDEGDETVAIDIVADSEYTIGTSSSGTVTIEDDDMPPPLPTITLAVVDASASEDGDTGKLQVTRDMVDATPLAVSLQIIGTATNGSDYQTVSNSITLPPSTASADIDIIPIDDTVVEGSETVDIQVMPGTAYGIGSPASGSVTIIDNDSAASLDVCENYNTGNVNKPGSFPSYNSLFEQSWTHRRDLNPATDIDVGVGPGFDESSLVAAFNNATGGETIVVHDLPSNEKNGGFILENRAFPVGQEVHIYFVNPITVTGKSIYNGFGSVVTIDNVEGVVLDGMNNLTVTIFPGTRPWALFFIGHDTPFNGYESTKRLIIKNLEADGKYPGGLFGDSSVPGPKWGFIGENNTDTGICNLYVHNIKLEHGFYFHHLGGNFEMINNRIDTVGRTCIQVRYSGAGNPTAKHVFADNYCSNSCGGGSLTADDPSGTWWIHGNRIEQSQKGITSIDSRHAGFYDHTDGEVYIYNNRIHLGDAPIQESSGNFCNNDAHLDIRDGGADFYMQNNVFLMTERSTNFVFREESTLPGSFPNKLVESNNNIFGLAHPSHNFANCNANKIARWDDGGVRNFLDVSQWQQSLPAINKPTSYGTDSQYICGDISSPQIQNLLNTYFP